MNRGLAWLSVAVLAVFLNACSGAVDQIPPLGSHAQGPSLLLSDTAGPTRTILPGLPAGSQYVITLGPVSGTTSVVTTSTLLDPIPVTESGPYTVQVTIRDSLGNDLATSAVLTVSVGMGPTALFVPLAPVGTANGSATFSISWPVVDVDSLIVTLVDLVTLTAYSTTSATAGELAAGALNLNLGTIPAGSYLLKVAPDLSGMAGDHPVWSSVVQIWPGLTTSSAIPLVPADLVQIPSPPSNLQVVQEGSLLVVTWKDESTTESNFRLYNSGVYYATVNPNVTRYAFSAAPGVTYFFSASAINARGESSQTAQVTKTFSWPTLVAVGAQSAVPIGEVLVAPDTTLATPIHTVTSISAFHMGQSEVTYKQWYEVRNWANDHGFSIFGLGREATSGSDGVAPTPAGFLPVSNISWRDAVVWCNALSAASNLTPVYYTDPGFSTVLRSSTNDPLDTTPGTQDNPYIKMNANGYRLPTEAEWESAARWIAVSTWNPGDWAPGAADASVASANVQGWLWPSAVQDVMTRGSTSLGLYDMTGNVGEWCQDWYGIYAVSAEFTDPDAMGATSVGARVFRGQYGLDLVAQPSGAAASYRAAEQPHLSSNAIGFRVARRP